MKTRASPAVRAWNRESLRAATLTAQQARVFVALGRYWLLTHQSCSVAYLVRRLHVSAPTVYGHLRALEQKGLIRAPSAPCPTSMGREDLLALRGILTRPPSSAPRGLRPQPIRDPRPITIREYCALALWAQYFQAHGEAPSGAVLARAMRITPRAARKHLYALVQKGRLHAAMLRRRSD